MRKSEGDLMVEEKILAKHPQPDKQGVRISKEKYELIRKTILDTLHANEGITFTELTEAVKGKLEGTFDGSIAWYVTTVKLDLEARNVIERVPETKPQQLRVVPNGNAA
jgi:hypothetical protein